VTVPFFSVAIPTKNRPRQLADAVRSVLSQTFTDLEVVICDNSDEADAVATAAVAEQLADPRLRYVRTSGQLSMPDNWEHAVAETRGQYVGIVTDRSVLRPDALRLARTEIDSSGTRLVNWFNDRYGEGPSARQFSRRPTTFRRYRFTREEVLDYFVHGHPNYAPKVIPKLMTSVCHRSVLDAIWESPVRRCCAPVSPDFTSGFLMLAHCDWFVTLDRSLYVSCGRGNGWAFRSRGELAERFRRDLGMDWSEMVDRMPSDACFSHAVMLNDLMRIKDALPSRLAGVEIDRAQYYLGCLNDYVKTARNGVRRDEDLRVLLVALEREPDSVQEAVRSTRIHTYATAPPGRVRTAARAGLARRLSDVRDPSPEFATVFDALAWDEAHPRTPAATSFLELSGGIERMRRPTSRRAAAREQAARARRVLDRLVAGRR
jgi:glycosyltransferase involved in cell wall biosynthesis